MTGAVRTPDVVSSSPMNPARETSETSSGRARRAAGPPLGVVLIVVLAVLLAGCSGSKGPSGTAVSACNGAAALCERRLDEVVFPATHNSFAAYAEPGWYFANQRYGISRQLEDGIRALLIDVHFGVYDPSSGRVRTDLAAEGSDRNLSLIHI